MTCDDDDDDDDDYDGGGSSMSVIRANRKRFWGTLFVTYSVQRHQFMTIFIHPYMVDNNKQTLIMTTINYINLFMSNISSRTKFLSVHN